MLIRTFLPMTKDVTTLGPSELHFISCFNVQSFLVGLLWFSLAHTLKRILHPCVIEILKKTSDVLVSQFSHFPLVCHVAS